MCKHTVYIWKHAGRLRKIIGGLWQPGLCSSCSLFKRRGRWLEGKRRALDGRVWPKLTHLPSSSYLTQQMKWPILQNTHPGLRTVNAMGNCFFGATKNTNVRVSLPAVCFVWQVAMIILFGVFIRYDEESDAHWQEFRIEHNITSDIENDFYFRYPSKYNLHPVMAYFTLFHYCL